jgi:hypothetical protein
MDVRPVDPRDVDGEEQDPGYRPVAAVRERGAGIDRDQAA